MFDSLRDKIHTVQEGLTASFRGLSVGDLSSRGVRETSGCNLDAGADLLHKYQTEWSDLHRLAEENAKKADEVDDLIGHLFHGFEKQWSDVSTLCTSMSGVPQILDSVQELMEQISHLEEVFDEVELALFNLEDMIETQELQEKQLDHRFQMALYKEKKLGELEDLREQLAVTHAAKVRNHEVRQQMQMKERQEVFQKAFEEEVQQYKTLGKIPKHGEKERLDSRQTSLEDVTLEDDLTSLQSFLDEDVELDNERVEKVKTECSTVEDDE